MRNVVNRYRWGRHALLAAAAWLAIVTTLAAYFLWVDGVEPYSPRALFVALVLMPAALALGVFALSFYRLRSLAAVAVAFLIGGMMLGGAIAYLEHQQREDGRAAAALRAKQQAAHRAELWRKYGPAVLECRGPWLDYDRPSALQDCVELKTGAPIDAFTWREVLAAGVDHDPLLRGLPDRN